MAAVGVACSFLPQEILTYDGGTPGPLAPLFIQLAGALYVAFAMLNWMSRTNLIGGIYSRPIATGNAMHFLIGAIALIKGIRAVQITVPFVVLTTAYSVFAVLFLIVLYTHPRPRESHS